MGKPTLMRRLAPLSISGENKIYLEAECSMVTCLLKKLRS